MISIQENIALAPLTTFRLGGEARFYAEVRSSEELQEALAFAKEKNIPFYILGGGSNVVVSDKGFAGLIIRIKINETCIKENVLEVGAGVPLIKAINVSAAEDLAGLESLAGIPGTVGGAVRGNAGAYGAEIGNFIKEVTAFDEETGETVVFAAEQCEFSYRSSFFKRNPQYVILSAKLELAFGDGEVVKQKMNETIATRLAKGLDGSKCAGSFFMNPVVENEKLLEEFEKEKGVPSKNGKLPAGWIIEQADLKGKKIGGAMVSEQHANYIINTGSAKAEDVMMLSSYVKQQVRDKMGVQLQEEVNYVGF